jgi:S-adenosylmethionine synthetase
MSNEIDFLARRAAAEAAAEAAARMPIAWRSTESVTEGHPDKVADFIADRLLDEHLAQDPEARVAIEVLVKGARVVLAGEVTANAVVDFEAVVRDAVRAIGYTDPALGFCADTLEIHPWITRQAIEIDRGVRGLSDPDGDMGAGDQGFVVGYATDETPERLPLTVVLAHRIARLLSEDRKAGRIPWARPDGKTQVTLPYHGGVPAGPPRVLVSVQHAPGTSHDEIRTYVWEDLLKRALGEHYFRRQPPTINPAGTFIEGGPAVDCGVTGRKTAVDTYGGWARHGGGAFSGKDPSKLDRSGAYFCRWVARQVVDLGLAKRVEIQATYVIGRARPDAVAIETFGTGDARAVEAFVRGFDFRPGAILERLRLRRPIYAATTNYGHFGRPGLPWEE